MKLRNILINESKEESMLKDIKRESKGNPINALLMILSRFDLLHEDPFVAAGKLESIYPNIDIDKTVAFIEELQDFKL